MSGQIFSPLPHQPRMLKWGEDHETFAYFVSPGMGKTPVTLKVLDSRMTNGTTTGAFIIAPKRVNSITWTNQVAQWAHSNWMRMANLRTPEGIEAWVKGTADIYTINPEMLPKLAPILFKGRKKIPVDTLIVDELSLAKNPTSKRFNSVRPYLNLFTAGRIGLTGTPVPNNYLDLYGQIRMLDDGARLGKSFFHYRQNYFTSDYMGFKYELRPGAKEMIDEKLSDMCLVMLGEDYLDIPTCSTEDVEVALPTEGKAAYKEMEKELLLELEKGDVVALTAATLVGKLLQITSGAVYDENRGIHTIHGAKIEALKKLRKKHGKEPILVLTAFKHESARILAEIPGAQMFDERKMDDWQAGKIHTWVADPRSLSHGIDGIQASCRIAVWMTLTYSNETYLQTNARLVRTGQSAETIIYRLIVSGTIDDAVAEALRVKSDTQSGLMNSLKALQQLLNTK